MTQNERVNVNLLIIVVPRFASLLFYSLSVSVSAATSTSSISREWDLLPKNLKLTFSHFPKRSSPTRAYSLQPPLALALFFWGLNFKFSFASFLYFCCYCHFLFLFCLIILPWWWHPFFFLVKLYCVWLLRKCGKRKKVGNSFFFFLIMCCYYLNLREVEATTSTSGELLKALVLMGFGWYLILWSIHWLCWETSRGFRSSRDVNWASSYLLIDF